MEWYIPVVLQNFKKIHELIRWIVYDLEVIDCHCCFMNFELNSAQRKINFLPVILFPLGFYLLWTCSAQLLYFMISVNSYMSFLFGRFPFWEPTHFLEAVCPRYSPDSEICIVTHIYIRNARKKFGKHTGSQTLFI